MSKAEVLQFANAAATYRLLYLEDPLALESTQNLRYVAEHVNELIGALAEYAFIGVFRHLMGSPLNMAAYVQLDAGIPNYFLQENHTTANVMNEILDQPLCRDDGYVLVPDRPGIGVDMREDKLARYPCWPHRISGWFRGDASVGY